MKINTKKIGLFLKSVDGADYIFMKHCIGFRNALADLIKDHSLTKKQVCEKFAINPRKVNDFIKGNYNYTLIHMSKLNALFMELEMETLAKNVPIQVAK